MDKYNKELTPQRQQQKFVAALENAEKLNKQVNSSTKVVGVEKPSPVTSSIIIGSPTESKISKNNSKPSSRISSPTTILKGKSQIGTIALSVVVSPIKSEKRSAVANSSELRCFISRILMFS